jgi:site-specific recombinase XerD
MIASLSGPAPAMRCEVAEFDVRGLPLRLRWTPTGSFLGARERGLLLPAAISETEQIQEAAIAKWKEHADRTLAKLTAYQYRWHLKNFLRWLTANGHTLAEVDRSLVERYFAELLQRSGKPNTVRMAYKALRHFFTWAVEQGAPANPLEKIKSPRVQNGVHLREELSDEEVLALLANCQDTPSGRRDRAMISLMAYCALRQGEVHKVDLGDVETRQGRTILWIWGKGHQEKDAYTVLPAPAENALRDWLAIRPGPASGAIFTDARLRYQGRRLSTKTIRVLIVHRMRQVGINSARKTTHSLRHSAITNAIRNGATPLEAMAMARHKDIKTTLIYFHEKDRLNRPAEDRIVFTHSGAEEKISDDQK